MNIITRLEMHKMISSYMNTCMYILILTLLVYILFEVLNNLLPLSSPLSALMATSTHITQILLHRLLLYYQSESRSKSPCCICYNYWNMPFWSMPMMKATDGGEPRPFLLTECTTTKLKYTSEYT